MFTAFLSSTNPIIIKSCLIGQVEVFPLYKSMLMTRSFGLVFNIVGNGFQDCLTHHPLGHQDDTDQPVAPQILLLEEESRLLASSP